MNRAAPAFTLCFALAACSGDPPKPEPVPIPRGPSPLEIESLHWLSGSWSRVVDGGRWEEHWTEPLGGTMVGMSRMVRGERTVFTESLRIEERANGVYYVAGPSNQTRTDFKLTEVTTRLAVFENPEHRTPHTIAYRRLDDGSLLAWIINDRGGTESREEFPMGAGSLTPSRVEQPVSVDRD